jgi:hypothetical protein
MDSSLMTAPRIPPNSAPASSDPSHRPGITVGEVLRRFAQEPGEYLLARWNWKSAVLSSLFRAAIFFASNLAAGLPAAIAAMCTEFIFRAVTSGFYGALTEGFREAEPPWAAAVSVMVLLPLANHSMEFFVHWMRGTRKLVPSIIVSVMFTALSTLFNLYAMRRGALIVGSGRSSLRRDLIRMPGLLLGFVVLLPKHILKFAARSSAKRRKIPLTKPAAL